MRKRKFGKVNQNWTTRSKVEEFLTKIGSQTKIFQILLYVLEVRSSDSQPYYKMLSGRKPRLCDRVKYRKTKRNKTKIIIKWRS